MTIKTIEITKIDVGQRLRARRQDWVDTFAEQITGGEELPPIEVVERADGRFALITGEHRMAAHLKAGRTEIVADVKDPAAFADDAACRLREIKENLCRAGLTELDRAVAIATWKAIYEAANPVRKRGGDHRSDQSAESALWFSSKFSTVSARTLGISERSVHLAVEIANGIADDVRAAIATHPVADHQAELLALAHQSASRQAKIVKLLLDPESGVHSVADAIAAIDKTPAPGKSAPWEKLADRFAKLKETQQHAFFEAHHDAIELWLAKRGKGKTRR
ncbi:ParB N-terminal domain-containing protein [Xanthobacteraceae bacterium Astr-EGSB]|uniref:ParB N-terminal domain-containing protein n=1 Tax=Astrobacterium formosum TaxID=3069710 RepID=UPI0027B3C284|nr:ParB N-terminal domain-containing protein [Xanthobacteraceae bacterium Astr-EGSB]